MREKYPQMGCNPLALLHVYVNSLCFQVCLVFHHVILNTVSLKIPQMGLEECWEVIARSLVSHGADGRPLGSVV